MFPIFGSNNSNKLNTISNAHLRGCANAVNRILNIQPVLCQQKGYKTVKHLTPEVGI